jgi:hypothetical protein
MLKIIEDWKQAIDCNQYTAAVLMDLSKAFDCLPHGLLILKLEAYGLSVSYYFKEQVVFTEQKLTLGSKISVKNIRLLRYYQLSTKIHYFTQNPPMMKQCRF